MMIELKRQITKLYAEVSDSIDSFDTAKQSLLMCEIDKLEEELGKQIEEVAYDALNDACYLMQNKLGITDGGYASVFFSDDKVMDIFKDYIDRELENML